MKRKVNDGGSVFPLAESEHQAGYDGMTLRQYYAGKVYPLYLEHNDPDIASSYAVEAADALIAELEKEVGK